MSIDHLIGKINVQDVVLPELGIEIVGQRGDEITVRCPDWLGNHSHGDRNPSMQVNEDKLVWNCFVCGGGDITRLVMIVTNCTEEEAITWLEEHSDLAPSAPDVFSDEIERILAKHQEQLEPLPNYPPDLLFQYQAFHPWLSDRGISKETAQEMQVGWDDAHCGIVIPVFHKRQLVGIQTRHLAQSEDGSYICPSGCYQKKTPGQSKTNVPKYKNTSNFPRARVLYNYDGAVEAAQARGISQVIVVESPMSVLYLKTHGIHHVVASFGNGLTAQQAALLYLFHDGVYLWVDHDKAGNKTLKDGQLTLEEFVPLFLIPAVPGEKADPGDVPPDQIEKYISAAYPAVLFPLEGLRVGIS